MSVVKGYFYIIPPKILSFPDSEIKIMLYIGTIKRQHGIKMLRSKRQEHKKLIQEGLFSI
jgi:hypothetical protein